MPEHKILYKNRDGVRRYTVTDDGKPGKLGVYTEMDMDNVLDSIQEAREVEATRKVGSTFRHLAVVPMTVYERSIHEKWDDSDWKKWLNDPDNVNLRVWKGQV